MTSPTPENSANTSQQPKKIVRVDILHLDEKGYGPRGKHTRQEWRTECMENLMKGGEAFLAWQEQWKSEIGSDHQDISFDYIIHYQDNSQDIIKLRSLRYSLDFICADVLCISFKEIKFLQNVYFRGATFSEYANFSGVTFSGDANFSGATFSGYTNFSSATFSGDANFSGATFSEYANFRSATFPGYANFSGATFSRDADFRRATFPGYADFRRATFSGYANFSGVTFSGDADFRRATFSGYANFSDVTFSGYAYFSGATFSRDADFRGAKFHQKCLFSNDPSNVIRKAYPAARFAGKADFENAIFDNVGHFERVRFYGKIPSFLGVKTATTRLEFSDDSYFTRDDCSEEAIKALGHLKRLADEHGQTDQALSFNALWLRAKVADPVAFSAIPAKLVTMFYGLVSDYGRSFTRPFLCYLVLTILTFGLAMPYQHQVNVGACQKTVISDWRAATEYSIYRTYSIMDFTDKGKAMDCVAETLFGQSFEPLGMRLWGIFRYFLGWILLFLTALGLRNKYRIK